MAYTCVLAPSHECDGCQECEKEYKTKEQWLWEKQEAEYDSYRDEEFIKEDERYDR